MAFLFLVAFAAFLYSKIGLWTFLFVLAAMGIRDAYITNKQRMGWRYYEESGMWIRK